VSAPERDVFLAQTLEVRPSGRDGWLLRVQLPRPLARPLEGGHFFGLRTSGADFPFLNRPFSVHDASPDTRGPELQFLLKVVGRGTTCLSKLTRGEPVQLVGPLGRPFPKEEGGATTLLVAGGVGLPPLFLWLRRRAEERRSERALLLYGARVQAQLFELEAAQSLGVEVRTATEDGSHGVRGRVDKLLLAALDEHAGRPVRVFTCGPDPMMAVVSRICAERRVPSFVSLETLMACGFGVCNACAVPVADGSGAVARFARACMDGPVMDGTQVHWQSAAH
jgi:dihydroorotate dehydrogenase electron transfer subunit